MKKLEKPDATHGSAVGRLYNRHVAYTPQTKKDMN